MTEIRRVDPESVNRGPRFLFDANVWMWVTWPGSPDSPRDEAKAYAAFFRAVRTVGAEIVFNPITVWTVTPR